MSVRFVLLSGVLAFAAGSIASAQSPYPIVDKIAAKVVDRYQHSSCQQLAAEREQPKSQQKATEEQRAVAYLHQNPQAAQYFISKVAAPIANKLFACGMIP